MKLFYAAFNSKSAFPKRLFAILEHKLLYVKGYGDATATAGMNTVNDKRQKTIVPIHSVSVCRLPGMESDYLEKNIKQDTLPSVAAEYVPQATGV